MVIVAQKAGSQGTSVRIPTCCARHANRYKERENYLGLHARAFL
jgi:hypothetical protein